MTARPIVAAVLAAVLVAGGARAHAHGHDAGSSAGRMGLLIVDHGEPPEYNQFTYWSFREFFNHLIDMGVIPSWLKLLDGGTVLADRGCYGCTKPRGNPQLIDAWLRPHDGPAVFVPKSDRLAAHYVRPGGAGSGEPDIFEHVGFAAWHEWELMGGRSPNYEQKLIKKHAVIKRTRSAFGTNVPVRVGYGIDPRIGGGHQGIRQALLALVNRDRVNHIVVAYHGVGFSDIMQTHMIRHHIHEILAETAPHVTVSYAQPLGKSAHYIGAVVEEVKRELAALPKNAPVAIHLSGHGLPTSKCGEYDCGADAYHRSSTELFERTRAAVLKAVHRPGKLGVFHLYTDGATNQDDPDDKVDSPIEALAKRNKAGYRYVIDIPYEFDSDSRDTLIMLRQGYQRPIPDWNHVYESRFRYKGMHVKISNASFGTQKKIDAFYNAVANALRATSPPHHDH